MATNDTSDAAMLARVREAMCDILEGRAETTTVNGETITYADIDKLRSLEQMYVKRINSASRPMAQAYNFRRQAHRGRRR